MASKTFVQFRPIRSSIAVVLLFLVPMKIFALDRLPTQASDPGSASLQLIDALLKHPKFMVCTSVLEKFIASLVNAGFDPARALNSQWTKKDFSPLFKRELARSLKEYKIQDQITSSMKDFEVLVSKGSDRCQISLDLALSLDQFKVNPSGGEEVINVAGRNIYVAATLLGASFSVEKKLVHFDPSKALTIFQQQGTDLTKAIQLLEVLETRQKKSDPATPNNNTKPPAS